MNRRVELRRGHGGIIGLHDAPQSEDPAALRSEMPDRGAIEVEHLAQPPLGSLDFLAQVPDRGAVHECERQLREQLLQSEACLELGLQNGDVRGHEAGLHHAWILDI